MHLSFWRPKSPLWQGVISVWLGFVAAIFLPGEEAALEASGGRQAIHFKNKEEALGFFLNI